MASKFPKEMREVEEGDFDQDVHTPFLRAGGRPRFPIPSRNRLVARFFNWIWVLSTFLFAFLSLELYLQSRKIIVSAGDTKVQGLGSELGML